MTIEDANSRQQSSNLEKEREALLQEALARPGVREVMEVHGSWKEQDDKLNPYRAVTRKLYGITYSDHANND